MVEKQEIEDSLRWADEVAEIWSNTTSEGVVKLQRARLVQAIERLASCMKDLDETLQFLDDEYEKEN